MTKRTRTARMEERAVQPDVTLPPSPGEQADVAHLRARMAEIEAEAATLRARPGTPAEWSVLMEAACGERDKLQRQLAAELAKSARMSAALRAIAELDENREAAPTIIQMAKDALA